MSKFDNFYGNRLCSLRRNYYLFFKLLFIWQPVPCGVTEFIIHLPYCHVTESTMVLIEIFLLLKY